MHKLSFPLFYQLQEGDQLETGALWVSTLGFVAGADVRVLVFMTVGLSSMTITCQRGMGPTCPEEARGSLATG